jgi:hypothetical protein
LIIHLGELKECTVSNSDIYEDAKKAAECAFLVTRMGSGKGMLEERKKYLLQTQCFFFQKLI